MAVDSRPMFTGRGASLRRGTTTRSIPNAKRTLHIMALPRLALCLIALALGCDSRPSTPAPQAQQPPTSQARPPSSPEERLQAWIPNQGGGANPHGGAAPTNPHAAGNAHGGAPSPHGPVGAMQGTVRETMNSGGYTYLRLDVSGAERWVATTQMPVAVGDQVVVGGGSVMTDFHSRTLDRTFPEILFAGEVRVVGGANAQAPAPTAPTAAPSAPPAAPAPSNAHAEAPSAVGPAARHGVVRETMNSGGYTYVRVEGGGTSTWAAVPQTAVAVGDEVDIPAGNEMPGFHSRTLDRTFEQLTFASGLRVTGHAR